MMVRHCHRLLADIIKKCTCISLAFLRILALCIAFIRRSAGRHLASFARAITALRFSSLANDDWFVSSEPTSCLPQLMARVPRRGLPLNKYRSGGQQHKKDGQQYRGHEPLAKIEFVDV
jgi:hypothetical protein